jgi:hypothetical protein
MITILRPKTALRYLNAYSSGSPQPVDCLTSATL